MRGAAGDASRLSRPGDSDLTIDVTNAIVTACDVTGRVVDVTLTVGGGMWSGEVVREGTAHVSLLYPVDRVPQDDVDRVVGALRRFQAEGTRLRMVSAPGRSLCLSTSGGSALHLPFRPWSEYDVPLVP